MSGLLPSLIRQWGSALVISRTTPQREKTFLTIYMYFTCIKKISTPFLANVNQKVKKEKGKVKTGTGEWSE
jgi:hypothetical protein